MSNEHPKDSDFFNEMKKWKKRRATLGRTNGCHQMVRHSESQY